MLLKINLRGRDIIPHMFFPLTRIRHVPRQGHNRLERVFASVHSRSRLQSYPRRSVENVIGPECSVYTIKAQYFEDFVSRAFQSVPER